MNDCIWESNLEVYLIRPTALQINGVCFVSKNMPLKNFHMILTFCKKEKTKSQTPVLNFKRISKLNQRHEHRSPG